MLFSIFGRFFEVFDEGPDFWTCVTGYFIKFVKLGIGYIILIKRNIKLRLNLRAWPLGIREKACELWIWSRIESFGNIGHDRHWCPAYLVSQAVMGDAGNFVMGDVGNFVNLSFQRHLIPSEFPPSYDCFLNTHATNSQKPCNLRGGMTNFFNSQPSNQGN